MRKNILDIGCAYVDIKDSGRSVDTNSIQSCDYLIARSQQEQTTRSKTKVHTKI